MLDLIRNETAGIDVAFWIMQDRSYSNLLISKHNAGVPVRILVDPRSSDLGKNPTSMAIINELAAAGIPMRKKSDIETFMHLKMMIFAGQNVVQFSGANYGPAPFTPVDPYLNYNAEAIYFTDDPSVVNSFKTQFEDRWTSTTLFADFSNIAAPLVRKYPVSATDPELSFQPQQSYLSRLLRLLRSETQAIDVIMFRITDRRPVDELLVAHSLGIPVRLLTDQDDYRNPDKLYHSYHLDRMYTAAVPVRWRAHKGQNHEKAVILRGQRLSIFGSTNWAPSRMDEHNYFTKKDWIFSWFTAHFDRKWEGTNPLNVVEYMPMVPRRPDVPVNLSPANVAAGQSTSVTLQWEGGAFAHKFTVLLGTSATNLLPVVSNAIYPAANLADFDPLSPLLASGAPECTKQPDGTCTPNKAETYALTGLAPGTTYYWKIVGRTMAEMKAEGPVWSFTTAGGSPPPAPTVASVSPAAGPTAGGSAVTITGTGFSAGALVSFGGAAAASVSLINSTTIAAVTPPHAAGAVNVLVTNADGQSGSLAGGYTYTAPTNQPPQVSITAAPTSGTAPLTVAFTSTASDPDGTINAYNWSFGDGGTSTSAAPSHTYTVAGTYTARLTVTDNGGAVASKSVVITVAPGNVAPTVSITSPADGAVFGAPAIVTINASAADSDGSVVRVEFYVGTTLLGSDLTSPYSFTWGNVAAGGYSLRAKAVDDKGAGTTSGPVSITVSLPDTIVIERAEYANNPRQLRVEATSTSAAATLKVYVTATGQLIGTLSNLGGGRYKGQFDLQSNPLSITIRSNLGGSASSTVASTKG